MSVYGPGRSVDLQVTEDGYLIAEDIGAAISRSQVPGQVPVDKFGACSNADNGVNTDVWDRANATDDQAIWVAPTQARIHNIASTDANDTDGGSGLRTLQVYGLTDWDTAETSEVVTMGGTANVATSNSYVIIHRKKALTWGASGPNVGVITATAQTDASVTAQINAGAGQTEMAIYGVPSVQTFYVHQVYANVIRQTAAVGVRAVLLVNPIPDQQLAGFIRKHPFSAQSTGTSSHPVRFWTPRKYAGPCIVKVQVNTTANDIEISAGFDGRLVTN